MAKQEKVRPGEITSIFQKDNSFTWIINCLQNNSKQRSNIFTFCGYCCHFSIAWDFTSYVIRLHGYPEQYIKKISCLYSVVLKCDSGDVCFSEISKKIHTGEEYIDIVMIDKFLYDNIDHHIFFISWFEIEECSFGMQTKPEITASFTERSTQTEPASSANDKENETFKFLEILSKDFGSLYESKSDPDCVLKVDETEFHVHRSVLAARSTVFGAMFHHDTSESQSGKVDIPDVDAASFDDVLYYIYAGKIRGLSPDTATTMYEVADKYALMDFRDKCLDFLMCNLTVENICDAALVAHRHAEMKLEDKVIEFIEDRLDEIGESERWKLFSDIHAKLANKLLFSAFQSSKKKLAK